MHAAAALYWLAPAQDFRARLRALRADPKAVSSRSAAMALANARLDFVQTNALDDAAKAMAPGAAAPIRLAILGSSTTAHLHAGIRVAGLRRGMAIETFEGAYGQYFQELIDPDSALHRFKPTAILFAFDARHVTEGLHAGCDQAERDAMFGTVTGRIAACWQRARDEFGCAVLQQTIMPVLPHLLGAHEAALAGSRAAFIDALNAWLLAPGGPCVVNLQPHLLRDGIAAWHDPALWHRAKQEITHAATPFFGDLVGRALAALQGGAAKCLVLDLDNTIWGGVIGDDGADGIILGQGSAQGEAFLAVQDYALELSRRGIILAVCSKNDESVALAAFEQHPEMILRRAHIASFVANWNDKPANLRAIAAALNIGLDALVFADDNPFERALVRRELPMVAVPELPDDPALYPQCIADAGYFESHGVTAEDFSRGAQYQANGARAALRETVTDMGSYLRDLDMRLVWKPFDAAGVGRITQLINKTNQFNLRTRRYTEDEVRAVLGDARRIGLQLRLTDRFGDNGIIAIVIGEFTDAHDLFIDSWLMSCRVLGRQVEVATLQLIAARARAGGAKRLVGEYLPTPKNAMVRDHYTKLGFAPEPGGGNFILNLASFVPAATPIEILEG